MGNYTSDFIKDALNYSDGVFDKYRNSDAMQELRSRLDAMGVEWRDDSDSLFVRTKINLGEQYKYDLSVIPCRDGFLEAWHPVDDSPQGGLTVDEVIAMLKRK